MQHLFGANIVKLRFCKWRRYRGRQPGVPAGDGATLVLCDMIDGLQWPTLEAQEGSVLSAFLPLDSLWD